MQSNPNEYMNGSEWVKTHYRSYLTELINGVPYAHFKHMTQGQLNQHSSKFREGYVDTFDRLSWSHQCMGVNFKLGDIK